MSAQRVETVDPQGQEPIQSPFKEPHQSMTPCGSATSTAAVARFRLSENEQCPIGVDFPSLLSSEPFTFLIGPEHKPVVVHSQPIQQLSPVLHSLITTNMKEGIEKQCIMEDVDWEVFVGLAEYAYFRDYSEAYQMTFHDPATAPAMISERETALPMFVFVDQSKRFSNTYGESLSCIRCKGNGHGRFSCQERPSSYDQSSGPTFKIQWLWSNFMALREKYSLPNPTSAGTYGFFTTYGATSTSKVSQLLVYHAKLAILGQRYLMNDLTKVCLANIYNILYCISLNDEDQKPRQELCDSVLQLLWHVYNDEAADSVLGLREMVSMYVAANFDVLETEGLQAMVESNGAIGWSLLQNTLISPIWEME